MELRSEAQNAIECASHTGKHTYYTDAATSALAYCQLLLAAPVPDYAGTEAELGVSRMSRERTEWQKFKSDVFLLNVMR